MKPILLLPRLTARDWYIRPSVGRITPARDNGQDGGIVMGAEAKEYAPRLSAADQRCIWFARTCRETNLDPLDLARLCALTRRAFEAGQRAANTGSGDEVATERVEAHAASMGLTTDWPGLYPRFRIESTGATLQLEVRP